jgi:glycosyltransferase XagB
MIRCSFARRWSVVVAAAAAFMLCWPTGPADASPFQEAPGGATTDETLLPPADGDDVQIAPVDQQPRQPEPRTDPTSASGGPTSRSDHAGPDGTVGAVLLILAGLGITGIAVARLARMLYAWRSPVSLADASFGPAGPPSTSFSLLVPARRAGRRLGPTLDHLATLDHPQFEILAIVPYDDAEARGAALAAGLRHPDKVHVVVDKSFRKARAAGLNAALAEASGEIVGVIEPGDRVHPRLLRHVDTCFAEPDVAAVQGGVQLTVDKRRWFGARHVVERYFWSRSRLHLHARQHFTPLEGSTVFVRSDVLRDGGGWDETCAAEGTELGIRLSVLGQRIVVAYSPELATQKAAAITVPGLLAERTQWIGGFVRVLREGHWRRLPARSQRLRAAAVLARPLVDAASGLAVVAAAVAAVTLSLRPAFVLVLLLPVVPSLVSLAVELVALDELGRIHDKPRRRRDRIWLVVSLLPYQLLMTIAAGHVLLSEMTPHRRRRGTPMPVAARPRPGRKGDGERLQSLDELDEVDLTAPHIFDLADPPSDPMPPREQRALPAAAGDR